MNHDVYSSEWFLHIIDRNMMRNRTYNGLTPQWFVKPFMKWFDYLTGIGEWSWVWLDHNDSDITSTFKRFPKAANLVITQWIGRDVVIAAVWTLQAELL